MDCKGLVGMVNRLKGTWHVSLKNNYFSFRTSPIHAEAPEFTDMSVEQEILVTGIKVVDLLAPYAKGGKIGQWSN